MLALGIYSYFNTLFSQVYFYYGIQVPWYYALLVIVTITVLVWEVNRLLERVITKQFTSLSKPRFLGMFFLGGGLISASIGLGVCYMAASLLELPAESVSIALRLTITYATRINLFLHILNAIFVLVKEYRSKQLEAEELKRISTQAELQSIKNQLNPHFLFNNLNVLSGLVIRDNPEANKFIESFSSVYRYILNSQQKELVAVREELEVIRPYIYLLEKRFPESIMVKWEIPDQYMDHQMVPASLQMLMENAIKHNVASRAKPLTISFSVENGDMLLVSNNVQPKQHQDPSTQWGLKNISKRYELVTGKDISVKKGNDHFSVLLPLIHPGL